MCVQDHHGKQSMAFKRHHAAGISLIEALVSMVIVAIVAMGGLSYEYLAAKHSLIARAQITATRTAQLLLEDWKSTGGSTEYDPSALGLGFLSTSYVPEGSARAFDSGITLSGASYSIEVNGLPMMMTLEYYDVAYDADVEVTLRQLAVVASLARIDREVTTQAEPWMGGIRPVTLTTFVRVDAAGG